MMTCRCLSLVMTPAKTSFDIGANDRGKKSQNRKAGWAADGGQNCEASPKRIGPILPMAQGGQTLVDRSIIPTGYLVSYFP